MSKRHLRTTFPCTVKTFPHEFLHSSKNYIIVNTVGVLEHIDTHLHPQDRSSFKQCDFINISCVKMVVNSYV